MSLLKHVDWVLALGLLYEMDISKTGLRDAIGASTSLGDAEDDVRQSAIDLAVRLSGNRRRVDRVLRGYCKNFTLERIPTLERNILRLGVNELLQTAQPDTLSILRICKAIADEYGGKDSVRFVFGVLKSVAADAEIMGSDQLMLVGAGPSASAAPTVVSEGSADSDDQSLQTISDPASAPGEIAGVGQVLSRPPAGPGRSARPLSEPLGGGRGDSHRSSSDRPRSSDRPGSSDRPRSSDRPGSSDRPRSSDRPGGSDRPRSSDRPGSSDRPRSSDRPGGFDRPRSSDRPGSSNRPRSSEGEGQGSRRTGNTNSPGSGPTRRGDGARSSRPPTRRSRLESDSGPESA